MTIDLDGIAGRLLRVRERIARAAERAGRDPAEIELVAVTKTWPVEALEALLAAGHNLFGENRVQEWLPKAEALGSRVRWHFIGHLQTNKAARVAGRVELIHSADSVRLLAELQKRAAALGAVQAVLLEINAGGEASKTGAPPADLPEMIEAMAGFPNLRGEGLMTVAPPFEDPEMARPVFARLFDLALAHPDSPGWAPRRLSMGMSGDLEAAIAEGATLVRVGSAIFGERR